MIAVENAGDGAHLTVKIRADKTRWPLLLDLIKALSNRTYDKDRKAWLIPFNILPDLETDLANFSKYRRKHPEKLAVSDAAQQMFDQWTVTEARCLRLQSELHRPLDLDGYFIAKKFPQFQKVGANFLYESRRAICGDPTGVGKSAMGLAATAIGVTRNVYAKTIIVCEAPLREKWGREVAKFMVWPIYPTIGPPKKRAAAYAAFSGYHDPSYLIVGFPTLRQGIIKPDKKVKRYRWDYSKSEVKHLCDTLEGQDFCVIVDEAQNCKHQDSLQSHGVKYLCDRAKHVYGLSATYVEGRLQELHSVFHTLRPEVYGTFYHFKQRHINESAYQEKDKYLRVPEAKRKARPYVVRRKIGEIDDEGVLPKILFLDRRIVLTRNQRALYRQVLEEEEKKRAEMIALRGYKKGTDSLWRMIRERQACLFPEVIDPTVKESPKFDELVNVIESFEREAKVVVFCHFQRPVELLIERLDKYWRTIGLHGQTKVDREVVRVEFQKNPDVKVLVTSDVWRQGQDLEAARYMINFDLLWNPAHMAQRAGRIRRFTSEFEQVIVYTLMMERTIEQYMFDEILEPKQELMIDFMDDGDEGPSVTREVIRDIIQNYRG